MNCTTAPLGYLLHTFRYGTPDSRKTSAEGGRGCAAPNDSNPHSCPYATPCLNRPHKPLTRRLRKLQSRHPVLRKTGLRGGCAALSLLVNSYVHVTLTTVQ